MRCRRRGAVLKIGKPDGRISSGKKIVAEGGAWVPVIGTDVNAGRIKCLEHYWDSRTAGLVMMWMVAASAEGISGNVCYRLNCDQVGRARQLTRSECDFSYRYAHCIGTGCCQCRWIVLREMSKKFGRAMVQDLCLRRHKFPWNYLIVVRFFSVVQKCTLTVGSPGQVIGCRAGQRVGQAVKYRSATCQFFYWYERARWMSFADVCIQIVAKRKFILSVLWSPQPARGANSAHIKADKAG